MSALETPPSAGLGRQIKGPSAVGSDPRRFWHLTRALAVTEFKLRFFGSVLGYAWQVMRPLLLFGVLYILFTQVIDVGTDTPLYGVALLLGLVLYTFLSEATGAAVSSVVDRENLVRKIEFPRLAVPLSVVLTALFNLGLNLGVVVVFLLASGGSVRWSWLEMIPLIVLLAILASGLAMLLSALFVRARDVKPIWDVVLQILFYGTPIFYTIETVQSSAPTWVAKALMLNPFAAILQQARHAVVDPEYVSASSAIGPAWRLIIPLAIVFGVFGLGYAVFRRAAPRLAEDL
ncbi:MAG: type transporter [Solirubrobacterales bacterium]|jgi:ABC-2 type transport system permease protein|nr:type transporter [Solirubrobacterales bacterium]